MNDKIKFIEANSTLLKIINIPGKAKFIIALAVCSLPIAALGAGTEKGLVLRQNSSVIGPTTVSVLKNHAKLIEHRRGLTFLIEPNRMIVFSPAAKAYYETSIDQYPGPPVQKLITLSGLSNKDYTFKKHLKTGSIMGHTTTVYDVQCVRKKTKGDIFADKFQDVTFFSQTGVDPKVARGICKIYGLPPFDDLPAELIYEQFLAMVKGISTNSIQEKELKASEFTAPKGFKKVASEANLTTEGDEALPLLK